MKVKEESEKAGLKLNIQRTKIMASGPITSWQIDGETMETALDFIFLGCKITADSDCSHEIKTLAPWKKSYDQLSVLKSRNITLPTKVHLIKAKVFPVVMCGLINVPRHQRVDLFALARETVIPSIKKHDFALSFVIYMPHTSTLGWIYCAEFPVITSGVRILVLFLV